MALEQKHERCDLCMRTCAGPVFQKIAKRILFQKQTGGGDVSLEEEKVEDPEQRGFFLLHGDVSLIEEKPDDSGQSVSFLLGGDAFLIKEKLDNSSQPGLLLLDGGNVPVSLIEEQKRGPEEWELFLLREGDLSLKRN